MSTIEVSQLLRPGLLEGLSILLAGAPARTDRGEALGAAVRAACAELGASVSECQLSCAGSLAVEEAAMVEAVDCALADAGVVDLLVVDGASLFTCAAGEAPEHGRAALRRCLDGSWNVTRAVADRAFLASGRGGRIVYLAPTPDAGEHADAARAGLENLARTLSIEWARHGITAVAIAPGAAAATATTAAAVAMAAEVAALTAYLASPAGAYFSGCLLDLRGPAGA